MKISTAFRHIREGGKSLIRNGWMTFASLSAIAISLFILGIFLFLAANVNEFAKQVESDVEIRVFLDESVKDQKIQEYQQKIQAIAGVLEVRFVSKEEGLDEFIRNSVKEEEREFFESLRSENPLPDSFTVRVTEPRNVQQVADAIEALNAGQTPPPVSDLRYGRETVEALFKVTDIIRNVGIVLVLCLTFTAVFLISNTIKLTILARQREIGIMKLVGATNSFIRWPFFVEGALIGLMGSLVSVSILLYGYYELTVRARMDLGLAMFKLVPFETLAPKVGGLLLGLGIVVGVWGSVISVRKFLRV